MTDASDPTPQPGDSAPSPESSSSYSSPRPRKLKRRWLRIAAISSGSLVSLVLAAISLLHTQTARELVLSRVFAAAEQETGWKVKVESSELSLPSGFLRFQGLVAGADLEHPFVVADAVEVHWIWSRLYREGLWQLDSVLVLSPALDLAAEIPDPQPKAETEPTSGPPVGIRSWRIERATALGKELSQGWLAGWSAQSVDLTGSLTDQKIFLDIEQGELILTPRPASDATDKPTPADLLPAGPIRFQVGGRLAGPLTGPWRLDDLEVSGDGLQLSASGNFGSEASSGARFDFLINADPAAWSAQLAASGKIRAEGDLDLRAVQGELALGLTDLPAETVEPFLSPEVFAQLSAAGTFLNADATLELDGPDPANAEGSAQFRWHDGSTSSSNRGDSDLGDRLLADVAFDAEGAMVFDAQVAPSATGVRRVSGRLLAEDFRQLGQAQLQDGKVEISTPSVTRTLSDLRQIWPASVPATAPSGELDLQLSLAGPLDAARIQGGGVFRPTSDHAGSQPSTDSAPSWLRIEVAAQPAQLTGELTVDLERLSLGNALPAETALHVCRAIAPSGSLDSQPCSTVASGSLQLQLQSRKSTLTADFDLQSATDGPIRIQLDPDQVVDLETLRLNLSADGPGANPDSSGAFDPVMDPWAWSYSLSGRADALALLPKDTAQKDTAQKDTAQKDTAQGDHPVDSPAQTLRLHDLSWDAELDGRGFRLSSLSGDYYGAEDVEPIPIRVEASGRWMQTESGRQPRIDQADAHLELSVLKPAVEPTRAHLWIRDGILSVDVRESPSTSAGRPGSVTAAMPLGTLVDFGISTESLPFDIPDRGPIEAWVDLPRFDSAQWIEAFHQPPIDARLQGKVKGNLTFDPAHPVQANGRWQIDDFEVTTPEHRWLSDSPVTLILDDGRLHLPMTESRLDDLPIVLSAESRLTPGWTFEDPIHRLPLSLSADLNTRLDASLLKGYTAPFATEGPLDIDIRIQGTRADEPSSSGAAKAPDVFGVPPWIKATFKAVGEQASLTTGSPYATRLSNFELEGSWAEGRLELENLRADLNEGELELFGRMEFLQAEEPGGELQMLAEIKGFFDRVRYRLDYGLTTLSSGNFTWTRAASPPDRLSANILVERGSARRRIDATRELLNQLLAPPALDLGPGQVPDIELDIDIGTIDGIRIKNNLADLHASWDLLSVEGPLRAPRTHGSIDITPDGRVYAYGQVLRIDSASLQLSGNPSLPSRLELETTSSIEDPSIATPEDRRFLASSDYPGSDDPFAPENEGGPNRNAGNQIASGLTTFYGNQLASRLGQSLGGTRIRYEPLWIFGETDPGARLVISQDLNAFVSLAVAVDVSQGREQVYLLDLQGLRTLPSLSATVFADEGERYGATLQQTLELGDEDQSQGTEQEPVLRRLSIEGADSISKRKLIAWAGVSKGDAMPSGSDFDLEIDLAESLRQQGFPGADIEARLVPVDGSSNRVDALVQIELGPEVQVELIGPKLPRVRRREIRALYQTDFSQQASMEAMQKRTIEVWRSLGYPHPEVTVDVDLTGEQPEGREIHKVTVQSAPGQELKLKDVELRGLDSITSAQLKPTLAGSLTRIRLALEQPQALASLKAGLTSLGLPEATIDSISVSEHTLILEITPGPQQRIADIEFSGFPAELRESVETQIQLKSGAPAAGHAIAEAALTAQWYLRSRGYPEATVRSVTVPLAGSGPPRLSLRLAAEPGSFTSFGTLTVGPDSKTRESWVRRMATFEAGEPFDASRVAETRRRLLQTRNFDHVRILREVDDEGRAELTFDLEEKPPYTLAYGLRWDRSAGWGGLIDVRRLNAGGRGIGLGARALWLSEQKSLRLYGQIPRLLGTDWDLELYGEGFETEDLESVSTEGFIFSGQLSFPLGKHTRGQLYSRFERSESLDLGRSLAEPELLRSPQVGMQWIHDRRDRPTDPRNGYFLSLDLTRAWDLENQDRDYRRIYGQASLFRGFNLLGRRWIWAQSIRAGAGDTDGELRRSTRFFAGGQYSVRGYDSRSLGPQETLDDGSMRAVGGEAMLILNQELRIPLIGDLSMAVFLDAGQVWGRLDDVDDALAKAAGLGARYRSPVGLLRLDIALPIDPRPEDDDFEIYFGFGQSF